MTKRKKFKKKFSLPRATTMNARGSPGHTDHTWRTMAFWGSQFPLAGDGCLSFQYCPFCGLWMDEMTGEVAERPALLIEALGE